MGYHKNWNQMGEKKEGGHKKDQEGDQQPATGKT
jgi:hypothetical protein